MNRSSKPYHHCKFCTFPATIRLQWRHNGRDGVSFHQHRDCLLNRLFRCRSKNTSKLRVTGLCDWSWLVNSPHKWPVTRKMFPSDDVIMKTSSLEALHILMFKKWGLDKIVDNFQATYSNAFLWMKMILFEFKSYWSLFPMAQFVSVGSSRSLA